MVIMISIKTKYGCAVVLELAYNTADLLSIKSLADTCYVPKKYLEQLLNALRKAGIVESVRGKDGGYKLAKDPEFISVLDIASVLEQRLSFSDSYTGHAILSDFWKSVDKDLETSFNRSIKMLVKQRKEQEKFINFCI